MDAVVQIAGRRRRDIAGPPAFGLPAKAAVPGLIGLHLAAGEGGRGEDGGNSRGDQKAHGWRVRAQPLNGG